MSQNHKTFIRWVIFLCLLGYLRIAFPQLFPGCLFRRVTGHPCPACGTTHAIFYLLNGDFLLALHTNILAFPILVGLVIVPIWLVYDLLTHKKTLFCFYQKTEQCLDDIVLFLKKMFISVFRYLRKKR